MKLNRSIGFVGLTFIAVSGIIGSGGIIFSFIGFRHAIDMAEEVKRPGVTIPLALITAIIIAIFIYGLLQVAFVGALDAEHLKDGWSQIHFTGHQGPLAAVIVALGISWLTIVLYTGAIAGSFGAALVAAGSTSRIVYSLSIARLFPALLSKVTSRQVPLNALLLNFIIGFGVVFFFTFKESVAVNSAAIVLSFSAGSISLLTFRTQFSNKERLFKLPQDETRNDTDVSVDY